MEPIVSVIIPVFNTEDYLSQCIESVLGQTLRDIEVICVDDGSTDSSPHMLSEFAAKDERLKIITTPHSNAGAARNAALAIARGRYVSFLDADDYFEPTFLDSMTKLAESNNLDVVLCKSFFVDDVTKKRTNHNKAALNEIKPDTVYSADDLWEIAYRYAVGWPWDKLYRRSFIEENGLRFQEQTSTNDAYFVYTALALMERFAYTNRRLVNHRVNNSRSIENTRDKTWTNLFSAVEAIREALLARQLMEKAQRSFDNWVAEMCLWNISSLKSSRESFYDFVQSSYAPSFAGKGAEYFYPNDAHARFVAWSKLSYGEAEELFRLLDERSSVVKANEQLQNENASLTSENARLHKLEHSRSYRVGRAATAPLRLIKSFSHKKRS